jgi:hypothetical protein
MLSVTSKIFTLIVIMLDAVMLSVVAPKLPSIFVTKGRPHFWIVFLNFFILKIVLKLKNPWRIEKELKGDLDCQIFAIFNAHLLSIKTILFTHLVAPFLSRA